MPLRLAETAEQMPMSFETLWQDSFPRDQYLHKVHLGFIGSSHHSTGYGRGAKGLRVCPLVNSGR